MITDKKILVLVGGWGTHNKKEVEYSIIYGNTIKNELKRFGYNVILKECTRINQILELKENSKFILYNTLYGKYGEDGILPAIFEFKKISYTGSGVFPSALSMDKSRCSLFINNCGINIPNFVTLRASNKYKFPFVNLEQLNNDPNRFALKSNVKLQYPVVVKPNSSSFSTGVSMAKNDIDLQEAIKKAYAIEKNIVIQEFIEGTTIHVPVLCGKALTPIECVNSLVELKKLPKLSFHTRSKTYIVPARKNDDILKSIKTIAENIYSRIGCRGLIRCDFKLTNDSKLIFLEINIQHSIRPNSIAIKSAEESNLSAIDLIEKIIEDRKVF